MKIEQRAKLSGGQEIGNAEFGRGVALSADGTTALVSGPDDGEGAGAVWSFDALEPSPGEVTWSETQKLTSTQREPEGHFGRSLALSGNGEIALIGEPGAQNYTGVVWVYAHTSGTWKLQAKLTGGEEHGPDASAQRGAVRRRRHGGDRRRRSTTGRRRGGVGVHALGLDLDAAGPQADAAKARQGEGRFGGSVAVSGEWRNGGGRRPRRRRRSRRGVGVHAIGRPGRAGTRRARS